MKKIYLAGGCFWGMEKLFSEIPGVSSVTSGYANGSVDIENPSYEKVCSGLTGYKETILVEYDESAVDLEKLLLIYFNVIDPTQVSRQGPDVGTQYQTGIYYTNDEELSVIDEVSGIVRSAAPVFYVEIEPFVNFWKAEEYHQKYLDKNPVGYCHISPAKISVLPGMSKQELRDLLKQRQYFI